MRRLVLKDRGEGSGEEKGGGVDGGRVLTVNDDFVETLYAPLAGNSWVLLVN